MAGSADHMLRLAVVTPSVNRRGGTEKCLSWLIEDLSRHADVTLFGGDIEQTDVSRCQVHRLPMLRHPRLARYLTFLGANMVGLALQRIRRKRQFDLVLATAGDCLASDVVYAHFCCAAWAALLRKGAVQLPAGQLQQRFRNLHYRTFLWVASQIERHIYSDSDIKAIIAVSDAVKAELVRYYGVDPARVTVIPNAADESVRLSPDLRLRHRREIRAECSVPEDAAVLLFVAAGDWKRKGLLHVLHALAILADPAIHLLVVGREDIGFYQGQAARLGLHGTVHFCGFRNDIERYYAAADAFVYPSHYEAFSLVTLEAAAAGLPLIVTNINGTAELLRDGENGFLVAADPADIAAKVRLILEDPARLKRMSAAAQAASRRFTRSAVLEQTLNLCSSVLASRWLEAIP